MQNSDAPDGKEIQDLQQLWQKSTKNESFTIKERAMMTRINKEVSNFNLLFGTGQWGQIILDSSLFCIFTLELLDAIWHNKPDKIAFRLAFMLSALSFLVFHGTVKFKMRTFNHTNNREYLQMQLMRVEHEIKYREKFAPILMVLVFGLLIVGMWNDLPIWSIVLLVLFFILVFSGSIGKGMMNDELLPLRSKLNASLQQLNEH